MRVIRPCARDCVWRVASAEQRAASLVALSPAVAARSPTRTSAHAHAAAGATRAGGHSRREQSRARTGGSALRGPGRGRGSQLRLAPPNSPSKPRSIPMRSDYYYKPCILTLNVVVRGRGAAREPPSLIRSPRRFAENWVLNGPQLQTSQGLNAFMVGDFHGIVQYLKSFCGFRDDGARARRFAGSGLPNPPPLVAIEGHNAFRSHAFDGVMCT